MVKNYKNTGQISNIKNSGRPAKVTERLSRFITREIIRNPFATSTEIKSSLPSDVTISASAIRKHLINQGYRCFKAKKKPFLTKRHKLNRLDFAKNYKDITEEALKNIIFSDETRICTRMSDRPPLVRRPKNSVLDEKYTVPTRKYTASVMIWACFSYKGLSSIEFVEGYMNNVRYKETLEKHLIHFIGKFHEDCEVLFQQDSAGPHIHTFRDKKVVF